jgi:methyl-accepting chemotaxis protein
LDTNSSFKILEQRTKEISKVVNVITNLSKQTNLLAINAAIQASSAGEAGKAFSVVANEIKRLADNSGKSATEINELVVQIQVDTLKASEMIDEMTDSIRKGESATVETSDAFKNISTSVSETVSLSESILNIAREQINTIKKVSRNTENMVIK